jgi:biopolymer transport protein ExbB
MNKARKLCLIFTLAAGLFVGAAATLHAQEAKPADPAAEEAVHEKSLWEQIVEGGWVMIPIGLISVGTLYLIVDGVMRVTNPKKLMPPEHVEGVKTAFRQGDYVGAYNFCKANPSAFNNTCRVMISLLGEGKSAVEEGMVSELAKENSKAQTFISYLSVVGVCAPMVGLVGTVTGMMKAFATLGRSGIGDPQQLSAAIGEVLTATAAGLFIAIPAFFAFYILRNRMARVLHDIEDLIAILFRKMPYDQLAGVQTGDEEIYAAQPNWIAGPDLTGTGDAALV